MEEIVAHKICPQCRRLAVLTAGACDGCGHVFQTRYDAQGHVLSGGEAPTNPRSSFGPRPTPRQSPQPPAPPAEYQNYAPPTPTNPPYYPGQQQDQQMGQPFQQGPYQGPQVGQQPMGQPYQQPYQQQNPYQRPTPPQFQGAPGKKFIQVAPGSHNIATPIIMGFLFVGLGQFGNKQTNKALATLGAAVVLGVISAGLLIAPIWLAALIDSIQIANRLNRGEVVGEWQFF